MGAGDVTNNKPIKVITYEDVSPGVSACIFDQELMEGLEEALFEASWHPDNGADDPWVDGYASDFAGAVLFHLNGKYELRRKVVVDEQDGQGPPVLGEVPGPE